ncbi:MAG: Spx/MgsR family RNA polymerase-binding regulatory protein [Taibaiella sp.]|nr:Spx/MgsR family RNA polymerase-binding regulatory protein [Taibaiella sp.]
MITIYGISNCDTMQKATKWLAARGVQYTFHNYKENGIDAPTLARWLTYFPANKLVNTKSTTYRALTDDEKEAATDNEKAIELMMKFNSVIKRPVWDFGNGDMYLGWNEEEVSKRI